MQVLVAVGGFSKPGAECLPGELLLPAAWCGRGNCTCRDEFHGLATCGTAAVGRVLRMRDLPRALVEAEVAAAMRRHEGYASADAEAAAWLEEVATIEEGRLVRREEGIVLPFPAAARIEGPHSIAYRLDDPL